MEAIGAWRPALSLARAFSLTEQWRSRSLGEFLAGCQRTRAQRHPRARWASFAWFCARGWHGRAGSTAAISWCHHCAREESWGSSHWHFAQPLDDDHGACQYPRAAAPLTLTLDLHGGRWLRHLHSA